MPQFQWIPDIPSGVLRNHALSRKLFGAAVANSRAMEYVRPVEGFGRKQGETVTLTRIGNISEPTSGKLTEGMKIPEDAFAISTLAITVSEFGRAVPYTSLAEDLAWFDLSNAIQQKLVEQQKLILDAAAFTAAKTAKVKYAPTGLAANNITTNGTFGAQAAANWNVFHVEEIRDYLFDTLNVPPFIDEDYVALVRTLGLRGIKRDPQWEEWWKYVHPEAKMTGEVGRIENIRFVEINHANSLGKVGASSVLGEGIVFGQDFLAMAEVQTPELRAAIPGDFGRSKAVAWYGILEFGLIWDTGNAGEARTVHVGST